MTAYSAPEAAGPQTFQDVREDQPAKR